MNRHCTEPVTFFVDSKPAIQSLTRHIFTSQTVRNCFETLCLLSKTCCVTLSWVKAHVGHHFNEIADQQAKLGTESEQTILTPIPWSTIKHEILTNSYKCWKLRWKKGKICRQTRLMIPEPDPNFSKYLIQFNRKDISLMIQFLTGHNRLLYHQYKYF